MAKAEKLDWLIADQLKAELGGAIVIGREIIVLKQSGSTNDAILQFSASLLPLDREGVVLFAEHQTAGRGQRGNIWESAAGKGMWFSIVLRPDIQRCESGRMTIWGIDGCWNGVRCEVGREHGIR